MTGSNSGLLAALTGAAAALLTIYLREAIRTAHERLSAAATLEGQLSYWLSSLLRTPGFSSILVTAYKIAERERDAVLSGDAKGLDAIREELEKSFEVAKTEIAKGEPLRALIRQIKALSERELELLNRELDRNMASFSDGTGFLTTQEAAKLHWHAQSQMSEVRSEHVAMLFMLKFLIAHIYWQQNPTEERVSELTIAFLRCAINSLKHLIPLLRYTRGIRERGVLRNLSLP